ncbi:VOC family protein [Arenicella xantha]|uniref:Glyoxalase/fosfomycin resistance/dioxygenase domain-containing protein n=1 Tax=Arenicella xantha TaxID=644221 RepID=A0A395JGD0_9GAMM|nr:VOC family protein [Arenicella xantha]RBP48526.1 hypothetical protein DFR28_10611 [Arenicella xantha]
MQIKELRVFIPCDDFDVSLAFYKALGFEADEANADLAILIGGGSTFFLMRNAQHQSVKELSLQLVVADLDEALTTIAGIDEGNLKYTPITHEPWGRVIYLTGPSGELWHVTELQI